MWFGSILNRVVSPVALGIKFFGMFAPIAFSTARSGHIESEFRTVADQLLDSAHAARAGRTA
jgi:hypothetical protein